MACSALQDQGTVELRRESLELRALSGSRGWGLVTLDGGGLLIGPGYGKQQWTCGSRLWLRGACPPKIEWIPQLMADSLGDLDQP